MSSSCFHPSDIIVRNLTQTGNTTSSTNSTEIVSTILRLYVNSVETASSRRLRARGSTGVHTVEEQGAGGLRNLLEDLGDLEVLHGPGRCKYPHVGSFLQIYRIAAVHCLVVVVLEYPKGVVLGQG